MTKKSGGTFNITTTNQNGGVNVGQVNFNLQPGWRDISREPQFQADLLKQLEQHKDRRIALSATMGDSEATTFAEQVIAFLKAQGFDVKDNPNQAVTHPPYKAVQLGGIDSDFGDYFDIQQLTAASKHNAVQNAPSIKSVSEAG